jgi:hypothetical protein
MAKDYAKIIIKQYGGILPFHEAFYIGTIEAISRKGVEEFDAYKIHLHRNAFRAINHLQLALTHAAAISRFFWPASPDPLAAARAGLLRQGYKIDDNDPLFDRALRNAIEHFDERLDKFLAASPTGPIVDMVLGDHRAADDPLGHVLRLVDPTTEVFVLLGRKYQFSGLEFSLRTINDLSAEMAQHGYRLPKKVS